MFNLSRTKTLMGGVFAAAVVFSSCSGGESKSDNGQENNVIPAVEAVKSDFGALPLTERLSGTVQAENQVTLSPEISAAIARVYVHDGEQVKRGAPLVKLVDDEYRDQYQQAKAGLNISQAQLKQAQAQLKNLQSQFKRMKMLRDKKLSSEQAFEQLQSQVQSAEADVELAQAQVEQNKASMHQQQNLLKKTTVRAPISGTVGQRNAEIGMRVSPGTNLFTIGNLEKVKINVVLTDNMLQHIEVGQNARVYAGDSSTTGRDSSQVIEAEVTRISPFLNDITRSTRAEIEVANKSGRLRPGMFVPVDIMYGNSQKATLIPTSALFTNPNTGTQGVYVASSIGLEIEPADTINPDSPPPLTQPTPVEFMPVQVLAHGRMKVGVKGIPSGKWVITVGQDLLSEGQTKARVRTVSWQRIFSLQQMQGQDLLKKVLKQQADEAGTPS